MVVGPVSSHCTTPTFSRQLSRANSEQFIQLSDDRKLSIQGDLQKTKQGLANPFACDELSAEDLIYNLFKIPHKSDASIGKLIMVLKNYGLSENDPRLRPMMEKIREIEREREDSRGEAKDPRHWKLGREDFKQCIAESLSLISKTLQNDLIVPCWNEFTPIIKDIFYKIKNEPNTGKVADYIPQLGRMSPDFFGVSVCTVDGQRTSFGDTKVPFCVQSVSKAFNYAIAASELGAEKVHQYIGQEPSGRLFNDICLDLNHKPHNPMVNSGAIIVTSLIQNKINIADRFDHMLTQYKKISGGEYVGFNNAVFLSERSTADRNFALAYYMKENGCFPQETTCLIEALDFYFQLCSLEVTCESAAIMAATLANGGVCPITGERCIGSRPCRDVLSLMNSCGMYDYSGQFAFHVGLPAKSGVSGIMIVVVPNLMGLALWSPPLDKMGNSCRGVAFCKELIQRFNFHNYDSLAHNESKKFDPRQRVGEREKDQTVSLLFAAKAGDLNTIRRMYMRGYDLEMADYDKRTALHLACSEGHADVTQFLIHTAKVRVDPKDRWNRTPLQDAKAQNHISCIQLLEKALSIKERHEDDEEDEDDKKDMPLQNGHPAAPVHTNVQHVPPSNGDANEKLALTLQRNRSNSFTSCISSRSSRPTLTQSPSNAAISASIIADVKRSIAVANGDDSSNVGGEEPAQDSKNSYRSRMEKTDKDVTLNGGTQNGNGIAGAMLNGGDKHNGNVNGFEKRAVKSLPHHMQSYFLGSDVDVCGFFTHSPVPRPPSSVASYVTPPPSSLSFTTNSQENDSDDSSSESSSEDDSVCLRHRQYAPDESLTRKISSDDSAYSSITNPNEQFKLNYRVGKDAQLCCLGRKN